MWVDLQAVLCVPVSASQVKSHHACEIVVQISADRGEVGATQRGLMVRYIAAGASAGTRAFARAIDTAGSMRAVHESVGGRARGATTLARAIGFGCLQIRHSERGDGGGAGTRAARAL
jgi:hypothetical protein